MCIYKSFAKTMQRYKFFTHRQWHKPNKCLPHVLYANFRMLCVGLPF